MRHLRTVLVIAASVAIVISFGAALNGGGIGF